ncbi:MAG: sulfurtransferase [Isosphaeraceae bacterium]|nr:sulfurtransferase [Isosphaeraceae bacterium]
MPPGVGHLSALRLKQRFEAGEPLALLDVREDVERTLCAIPAPLGATDLHIPMGQVPARLDEIRRAVATAPLVVYCHLGQRSLWVARWLAAQGVAGIHNLSGGIDAWSEQVDPTMPRY